MVIDIRPVGKQRRAMRLFLVLLQKKNPKET